MIEHGVIAKHAGRPKLGVQQCCLNRTMSSRGFESAAKAASHGFLANVVAICRAAAAAAAQNLPTPPLKPPAQARSCARAVALQEGTQQTCRPAESAGTWERPRVFISAALQRQRWQYPATGAHGQGHQSYGGKGPVPRNDHDARARAQADTDPFSFEAWLREQWRFIPSAG